MTNRTRTLAAAAAVVASTVLLLVLPTTTTAATTQAISADRRQPQQHLPWLDVGAASGRTRLVSIKLIPHHVHEARVRRRRRRRWTADGNERRQRSVTLYGRRRRSTLHRAIHETDDEDEDHDEDGGDTHEDSSSSPSRAANSKGGLTKNANSQQIAGLFQGYGTHYADLWCGSPARQRQTVIVDTGSGVTAFPVVGCAPDNCGVPTYHINPLYDPSNSTTFERVSCAECQQGYCNRQGDGGESCLMSMSYAEGSSWSAYQCREDVYVGGLHSSALPPPEDFNKLDEDSLNPYEASSFAFPLVLGCQTKVTKLFKTQLADGIMGMDRGGLAFWAQMSSHLGIVERKFSLCFSRSPTTTRNGSNAGAMTLGGTDERLHSTPMVHSAIGVGSGFYDVTIRQIYLREGSAGESAKYDPSAKIVPLMKAGESMSGIVDSGTTGACIVALGQFLFSRRLSQTLFSRFIPFEADRIGFHRSMA
jgi:Xylanase inhibitor N-terminal